MFRCTIRLILSGNHILQIFFRIEELLVHLENRNEDHSFCVLRKIEFCHSPLFICNLVHYPSVVEIVSRVINCDTVEVLEEILKKHPESTIICCSEGACRCDRLGIFIMPLSELLINVRILVPCFGVIRPWSKPLFLTPRFSQLHQVSVLLACWIRVELHSKTLHHCV